MRSGAIEARASREKPSASQLPASIVVETALECKVAQNNQAPRRRQENQETEKLNN